MGRGFHGARERLGVVALACCAWLSVGVTAAIAIALLQETILFFGQVSYLQFFLDTEWTPLFWDKHYGIWPLVCGTVITTTVSLAVAIPAGTIIALFLAEWAPRVVRMMVKPLLEILSGIPTIVFGYFAVSVVTPVLRAFFPSIPGFNALSAGIVMGIMMLPLVATLVEDALTVVPQSYREASYALGAGRFTTMIRVTLPAAAGGVTAAAILALSRALGETMIVTIAAGQQPRLSLNPLQAVETLTAFIAQVVMGDTPYGSIEHQAIFVVGSLLFLGTLTLNVASIWIRERFAMDR
jgi:phosphate transport system permease protein